MSPCLISYLVNLCLALESYIKAEGIPVDNMVIKPFIPKDRRHASKPDTAVLFGNTHIAKLLILKFVLKNNPIFALFLLVFLLCILIAAVFLIF